MIKTLKAAWRVLGEPATYSEYVRHQIGRGLLEGREQKEYVLEKARDVLETLIDEHMAAFKDPGDWQIEPMAQQSAEASAAITPMLSRLISPPPSPCSVPYIPALRDASGRWS